MKKKLALIILVVAFSSVSSFCQSLTNTTWKVYDSVSSFYNYFRFDSLYLSYTTNEVNFNNVSTYYENGSDFTIIDIPGFVCSADTGRYTFLIHNDTLDFSLVNDTCPYRSLIIADYYWVRNTITQVENTIYSFALKIFPNPANDEVFLQIASPELGVVYHIFNLLGSEVLKGSLESEITRVDISELQKGCYFIKVGNEPGQPFKIIKS